MEHTDKCKSKMINLLKENIGENLGDLELDRVSRCDTIEEKTGKRDFHQKMLCASKDST